MITECSTHSINLHDTTESLSDDKTKYETQPTDGKNETSIQNHGRRDTLITVVDSVSSSRRDSDTEQINSW